MTDSEPELRVISEQQEAEKSPASIFNDLSALRQETKLTVRRKAVLINVEAGNPPKDAYFRAHPDPNMTLEASVVREVKGADKRIHFITPSMYQHPKLARRLLKVTLALITVWPGNDPHIWPVPVLVEGRDFPAWKSAREAHKLSLNFWTQMTWDNAKSDYAVETAEGMENVNPIWPDKTFNELLKLAFDGRIIDNEDHPYVRQLRGIID